MYVQVHTCQYILCYTIRPCAEPVLYVLYVLVQYIHTPDKRVYTYSIYLYIQYIYI